LLSTHTITTSLSTLQTNALHACDALLEDPEVRVRWAVGETLRALCTSPKSGGAAVWERMRGRILKSIHHNFDRDTEEPSASLPTNNNNNNSSSCRSKEDGKEEDKGIPPIAKKDAFSSPLFGSAAQSGSMDNDVVSTLLATTYRPQPAGTGEMRHGTEGWKCLETSFRALQHIIESGRAAFRPYIDGDLRQLVYRALRHPNRFVREACQFIVGSIALSFGDDDSDGDGGGGGNELTVPLIMELASELARGLGDNWSQVRYAASVSTRKLVIEACRDNAEKRKVALMALLPQMALNRYYVAEGVRLYSQETWRLATTTTTTTTDGGNEGEGRELMARCAPAVINYYILQSKADNHAVREAACACIAELMAKVDKDTVAPYVPRLLKALMFCFKDASWPVRDAACLACGRAVKAFPQESTVILEELYKLWFAHLWDNIYSVREDSAIALGDAARAYGEEAVRRICEKVGEMLPMAKQQPADSKKAAGLENTTLFGVAAQRAKRANDPELHTDKTMFSCGSLAPKLQRGGGCVDHGFAREKEPWEASDGAVYMLRELSTVTAAGNGHGGHGHGGGGESAVVVAFLPTLAEISRLCHFSHCLTLQENIWKQLPIIARNIGKKAFKPHLEAFLQPMFRGVDCGHRLCEAAAGRCIGDLRDFIGPNIFAGRLDDEMKKLMVQSPNVPPSP
jgi:hypothetical protein